MKRLNHDFHRGVLAVLRFEPLLQPRVPPIALGQRRQIFAIRDGIADEQAF